MDFFSGKKGRKKSLQNGQPGSQSVRNRSGKKICLLLWASNRPLDGVKGQKVVKKHVFWGLDPVLTPKFPREKWKFELAREYLRTGAELRETVMGSFVPGIICKKMAEKFLGSVPPVFHKINGPRAPQFGGGGPFPRVYASLLPIKG